MKRCVLDTSVVIKWFSEYGEDDLDKALALREGIFKGAYSIVVPDLLFYELANALRYNPRLDARDVGHAVQSVLDMGFDIRTVEAVMLERSVDAAYQLNITVYDSYFLSLAHAGNMPLITADYKMAGRLKGSKHLLKLSDFPSLSTK
jgi:predicted nucleic acid-binding protein